MNRQKPEAAAPRKPVPPSAPPRASRDESRPTEASIEKVFLSKNPSSALKLGQARGAAIVCCRTHGVAVHEYSAREIKAAATGHGGAPKEQVAGMVARLLGISQPVPADASDALAMAFCRAVTRDLSR